MEKRFIKGMGMDERAELYAVVTEALIKSDFKVSDRCVLRPACFDIFARKEVLLLLIKILANIDSISQCSAREMRWISSMLSASPLVIGRRTRMGEMEEGLVYERFGVPAISPETLESILLKKVFPIIFSSRGGYYVKIDGGLLKTIRLERGLSLGDVAEQVGVSRRTIYNYENNAAGATFDTALRLENFLDESLAMPLNIFEVPKGLEEQETFSGEEKERSILERLSNIGFQVYPVRKAPFSALTVEEDKVMLTEVARARLQDLIRRAKLLSSISRTTLTSAFFVMDSDKKVRKNLEGIPVVGRGELEEIEDSNELLEKLRKKSPGKVLYRSS
jgi:putative transcriptional regulator